jgi:hypothetical protein
MNLSGKPDTTHYIHLGLATASVAMMYRQNLGKGVRVPQTGGVTPTPSVQLTNRQRKEMAKRAKGRKAK